MPLQHNAARNRCATIQVVHTAAGHSCVVHASKYGNVWGGPRTGAGNRPYRGRCSVRIHRMNYGKCYAGGRFHLGVETHQNVPVEFSKGVWKPCRLRRVVEMKFLPENFSGYFFGRVILDEKSGLGGCVLN